jgi:hypothetical protein
MKKFFYALFACVLLFSSADAILANPHRLPVRLIRSANTVNYTPDGPVIYDPISGNNYGTIFTGGAYNQGAVYSILNGTQQVLSSFGASKYDGSGPVGGLINTNNGFYGVTAKGGATGDGTIFLFNQTGPNSGTNQIVFSFNKATTGGRPTGLSLSYGLLCGVTTNGSTYGYGSYFCFNPVNLTLQVIYPFPS